jgi:hypothetical protein
MIVILNLMVREGRKWGEKREESTSFYAGIIIGQPLGCWITFTG